MIGIIWLSWIKTSDVTVLDQPLERWPIPNIGGNSRNSPRIHNRKPQLEAEDQGQKRRSIFFFSSNSSKTCWAAQSFSDAGKKNIHGEHPKMGWFQQKKRVSPRFLLRGAVSCSIFWYFFRCFFFPFYSLCSRSQLYSGHMVNLHPGKLTCPLKRD